MVQARACWDNIPTARVRSVGVLHAIELEGLSWRRAAREGDSRLVAPVAVKETIFDSEHMKSVSMPSEVLAAAGLGAGLLAARAGSVKLRRVVRELKAGACSGILEEAGDDMMGLHVSIAVCGSQGRCRPKEKACSECDLAWLCRTSSVEAGGFDMSLARNALAKRDEFQGDPRLCPYPHQGFSLLAKKSRVSLAPICEERVYRRKTTVNNAFIVPLQSA